MVSVAALHWSLIQIRNYAGRSIDITDWRKSSKQTLCYGFLGFMRRSEKGRDVTMTLLESIPRRGMEADNFKVTGVAISASVCLFFRIWLGWSWKCSANNSMWDLLMAL